MAMGKPLLRVRDLRVRYAGGEGLALDGVSFDLAPSRVLGVVGESGCGKSTLACAIPRLLPASAQAEGQIAVDGEDVFSASPAALRRLRGGRVGMVFQDAGAALDGAFTLGSQLRETLRLRGLSRAQAKTRAAELLSLVGIDAPERRLSQYPHELSGGQKQRVWIAMALAQDTKVLFLDEPTTYLDIRYQLQILKLIRQLNREFGITIVMVLHDINQSLYYSDEIVAMKDGRMIAHSLPEEIISGELVQEVYDVNLDIRTVDGKPFVIPV